MPKGFLYSKRAGVAFLFFLPYHLPKREERRGTMLLCLRLAALLFRRRYFCLVFSFMPLNQALLLSKKSVRLLIAQATSAGRQNVGPYCVGSD